MSITFLSFFYGYILLVFKPGILQNVQLVVYYSYVCIMVLVPSLLKVWPRTKSESMYWNKRKESENVYWNKRTKSESVCVYLLYNLVNHYVFIYFRFQLIYGEIRIHPQWFPWVGWAIYSSIHGSASYFLTLNWVQNLDTMYEIVQFDGFFMLGKSA